MPDPGIPCNGRGTRLDSWIGDEEALTTEHEVIVVGMHPQETYRLEPVSAATSSAEARGDAHYFETGALPLPAFSPRQSGEIAWEGPLQDGTDILADGTSSAWHDPLFRFMSEVEEGYQHVPRRKVAAEARRNWWTISR